MRNNKQLIFFTNNAPSGWGIETTIYCDKFSKLIDSILGNLEHVLPENRVSVAQYIDSRGLYSARRIFDSVNRAETDSTELRNLVQQRIGQVEARLSHRLQARKYVVDAAQDVEFICGAGRIEKVSETSHRQLKTMIDSSA